MSFKSLKDKIKEKTGLSEKSLAYIIIALFAVLLLIIINSLDSAQKENSHPQQPDALSNVDEGDYCGELTKMLESIVSEIEGAGRVRIMITVSGTAMNEYQTDTEITQDQQKSRTVIIGSKEALLKGVLNPQVEGVLVVCDGGGSVSVREKVINAVSTVLNISSNKVYVTNRIKER